VDLAISIINVVAAVLVALATAGAWLAARHAAGAAASLTTIERHRWHAELTPQFDITCRATSDVLAELRVAFVGPAGLNRLDEVIVSIRDDIRGRAPVTPGGPTAEQIAGQIWGPYKFRPGVDGADPHGRSTAPVQMLLGDWRPYALEWTLPPMWMTSGNAGEQWWQQYIATPVRLTVTCVRDGREPWTVPREVTVVPFAGSG
jgi:hypothetical protein